MALIKARSRGINLADNFAFTGTISGAGGGKVLQAQNFYTHAEISTSATSDTATIVTDQITPAATNSKILIWVQGGRGSYGGGSAEGVSKLYRKIGSGSYSELRVCHLAQVNESGGYGKPTIAFNMMDTSHNTTDAIDYKIYIKTNANTYYFNSSGAQISMMLMELSA
tara:strand:- start:244 stop:747 length:504 start_codon:yes stop_codon:yes gene_type:complete